MIDKKRIVLIIILLFTTIFPLEAQVDVLCVGNSITWGTGLIDRANESYPTQLGTLLGSNYYVENRGEPGSTLLYWPYHAYMKSGQFAYSIVKPWDIVIICLGTNDSDEDVWYDHQDFVDDYKSLINAYKNYPGHDDPIFILSFPPPVFDESNGHRNAPIIDEIIPMVKQLAKDLNCTTADFYSALAGKPEMFTDGVHPNKTGALIMAQVAQDAIERALTTTTVGSAPSTPTGLTTIPYLNSIGLEWHSNLEDDIYQYRVFRANSEYGYQTLIKNVIAPDTTFIDNSVVKDVIYYYAIDATDLQGDISSRSHTVPGKTFDQNPPAAPSGLTSTLEADSVKLSWIANIENDLSKYYVYRNTNQNDLQNSNSIIATVYPPLTTYNDVNYASAETYFYGLKTQDVSGNLSSLSNIVNVTARARPTTADTTIFALEDVQKNFATSDFPFQDAEGDTLDGIILISSDNWEYFQYNGDSVKSKIICDDISKLFFKADSNVYGSGITSFKFKVIDSFGGTSADTSTAIINVESVNDEPTLDPIDDIHLFEDSHDILIPLTGIGCNQVDEEQNISIEIIPPDTALFNNGRVQYTSPDEIGFVTVDPKENVFGPQTVTIRVWDDGGTENGGVDHTDESFILNIEPRNDPPTIDTGAISIYEDRDTTITIGGIHAGPWESDQNISISVLSNNTDILPTPNLTYFSPDTFALLHFTTISEVSGNTSITIKMSDDGGTNLGGKDSTSYTIPVQIISVNDKPSEFVIIAPSTDSTLVIDKYNMNSFLSINWEPSTDIDGQDVAYNIIFNNALAPISIYGINSTNAEILLKDILAVTDTVSVTTDTYNIIATDGELETLASNSGLKIIIDGRAFAPAKLNLDQNYPNPFNANTLIGFDLPKRAIVSLSIIDLLGQEVIKLINNKFYDRGYNTVAWDALDANYDHVPSGIYLIKLEMGKEVQYKKLLLIK